MHKSKVDLFISQFGYNEAAMMHRYCDLALFGMNIHKQNRICYMLWLKMHAWEDYLRAPTNACNGGRWQFKVK